MWKLTTTLELPLLGEFFLEHISLLEGVHDAAIRGRVPAVPSVSLPLVVQLEVLYLLIRSYVCVCPLGTLRAKLETCLHASTENKRYFWKLTRVKRATIVRDEQGGRAATFARGRSTQSFVA